MATLTTLFGLRKPASSDLINVTTDVSDNMDKIENAIKGPPRATVRRNTVQSIPGGGVWALLSFNVEDVDTDNLWVPGAPDRFTATRAGRYFVSFSCALNYSNALGIGWAIALGVTPAVGFVAVSELGGSDNSAGQKMTVATDIVLAAGGTCSCQFRHDSNNVARDLFADGATTPFRATIRWVAES